uniref:SHC-transforming protein 1 n=1 Tax=Steinernema glaseri TaxID=37863 RepID=A0A1I7ZEA2_9BILA
MTTEEQLKGSGARFRLKFLGNVAVSCSMRKLMEETERDRIVQECIYMVCSHPDLMLVPERAPDDYARNLIGTGPIKIANKTVDFVITASALTLVDGDPTSSTANQVLHKQMITNVSIATPGRDELSGFIAYMVKLKGVDRRCMVYECNTATATAILALIKNAFSIINKTNGEAPMDSGSRPAPLGTTERPSIDHDDEEDDDLTPVQDSSLSFTDKPYVPGSKDSWTSGVQRGERTKITGSVPPRFKIARLPNRQPAVRTPVRAAFTLQPKPLPPERVGGPVYVNTSVEYADLPPGLVGPDSVARGLDREAWFHGVLSRDTAEKRLLQDGDYLVRQSENAPGQYVLSGMQANQPRHILLIDDGKVRTRDKEFESIIALICFHRDHKIPITSDDSMLMLTRPIPRLPH